MVTKTRTVYDGSYQSRNIWSVPFHTNVQRYDDLTDILISGEHPDWRHSSDGGGPLIMVSDRYKVTPGTIDYYLVKGPVVIEQLGYGVEPPYIPPIIKSDSYGHTQGATAIARSLPTNPSAQLSTALGELRADGLPSVIGSSAFKSQVHTARKAGDEYLNYEFGWLPLVSDLKKFAYSVKHRHEIMHGYLKYSDKQIRRRYVFPPQEPQSATTTGVSHIEALSELHLSSTVETGSETKEWFSGAFKYHVPTPTDFGSKAAYYQAEASKILGLELTPEVVWNLAPWSWAVDWFTNTGDVIHNISRLGRDGLVMRYGYQMYQIKSFRSISAVGDWPATYGFSSYFKKEQSVKMRWKATPYGFGYTFDGLSDTQKAVVVALGLSRAF